MAGFSFYIRQLDRRILKVVSDPGVVYKPNDVKSIMNEGMPSKYNSMQRGNLYVQFNVVFPESFSLTQKQLKVFNSEKLKFCVT